MSTLILLRYAAVAIVLAAVATAQSAAQQLPPAAPPTPSSLPTPLMGWNPFNAFGQNYDEHSIDDAAQQLVALGLRDLGYQFVDIDDSWWLRREPETMAIRTNLYPSARQAHGTTSFRPLVQRLHSMGLKAGIYTDIGRNTCSQRWEKTANMPEGTQAQREVGSFGHQQADAHLFFSEWGFDLVKIDACGVADYTSAAAVVRGGTFRAFEPPLIVRGKPAESKPEDLASLYASFWRSAVNATSEHLPIVSICAWGEDDVNDWGSRSGQMWRTSYDVKANWKSVLYNFDSAAPRSLFAGPGRWNDPDLLEVGNGEFDKDHLTEARAHMSMWAVIAAPLIISTDLRKVSPAILDILRNPEVLAVDQDPAGNQGVILSQAQDGETVVKTLSHPGTKAVALINRSDHPLTLSLGLSEIHLSSQAPVMVRDVWRGTSTRLQGATITVQLMPKETALLRVEGTPLENKATFPDEMPARIRVLEDGFKPNDRTPDRQWVPARIGFLPYGEPILHENRQDTSAIGVAAGSRIQIDLHGDFKRIELTPRAMSSAVGTYSIFADGKPIQTRSANGRATVLHVEHVQTLELVAPAGGPDHTSFAWAQLRFER